MIASRIEGRIRFRHPALTDRDLLVTITDQLANLPGITGLEANPRTGSLLVTHDARLATEELVAMATALAEQYGGPPETALPAPRPAKHRPRHGRRLRHTQQIGLASAMVATLASGLIDNKSVHLAMGLSLAGLAAWHVFQYRRRFLA